jgi:hypothetical protein
VAAQTRSTARRNRRRAPRDPIHATAPPASLLFGGPFWIGRAAQPRLSALSVGGRRRSIDLSAPTALSGNGQPFRRLPAASSRVAIQRVSRPIRAPRTASRLANRANHVATMREESGVPVRRRHVKADHRRPDVLALPAHAATPTEDRQRLARNETSGPGHGRNATVRQDQAAASRAGHAATVERRRVTAHDATLEDRHAARARRVQLDSASHEPTNDPISVETASLSGRNATRRDAVMCESDQTVLFSALSGQSALRRRATRRRTSVLAARPTTAVCHAGGASRRVHLAVHDAG